MPVQPNQPGWTPAGSGPGGAVPGPPGAWGGPPPVKAEASPAAKMLGWFMVGAAGIVVVGSVLPWISLSGRDASLVEELVERQGEGLNGLDKDGVLTIILGLVAAVMGVLRATGRIVRPAAITGAVMGVLTALIAVVDIADVQSVKNDLNVALVQLDVAPGIGLWLTLLGGVAVTAVSVYALRKE